MLKNGEFLELELGEALEVGEIPYQAALKASKAIDWYDDEVEGDKQLEKFEGGIDLLLAKLKEFRVACKTVQRRALAAVRQAPVDDGDGELDKESGGSEQGG